MKAVILAAGKGTRMGDLTDQVPKPMLRVQGRPILEHILSGFVAAGVTEVCIITGWRAEVIEDHFGDGASLGARIHYARQTVQDGTGKAPELARDFVGCDPFLLTYGDILVKPDTYRRILRRFRRSRFLRPVDRDGRRGRNERGIELLRRCLLPDPAGGEAEPARNRTTASGRLAEAGQPVWYNAGIYLFQPVLFDFTARLQKSPRGEYELTDAISAMVASGHRLAGLRIEGRWVDVRDPGCAGFDWNKDPVFSEGSPRGERDGVHWRIQLLPLRCACSEFLKEPFDLQRTVHYYTRKPNGRES
jgi:UDP-N-acetylglucosamine diphosphorylase / glucose-1-phosphate thymidylyltransferase / UDP-N-acetylgalactosamine diphosphorylase / glucosamine-1-phosphate N-acetyltransferase / galactosamine-1-phosphate N-acetyltransferase